VAATKKKNRRPERSSMDKRRTIEAQPWRLDPDSEAATIEELSQKPLPRGLTIEAPTWRMDDRGIRAFIPLDESGGGKLLTRALYEFHGLAGKSGDRKQIQVARVLLALVTAAVLKDEEVLARLEGEALKHIADLRKRRGEVVELKDWGTWDTAMPFRTSGSRPKGIAPARM
jgi:hypothetical protein